MSSIIVSQGELYQIVKKRKLETIWRVWRSQSDGTKIDEPLNELIIENKAQKFIELFEKTFSEETEEIDCEDGTIQDISKVLLKIKEKIESSEISSTGLKLLKLLFIFVESLAKKHKNDRKNKNSSLAETSTSKH